MNFICRTLFISYLGVEYLGLNGLFTNLLSVLSLAELGIGGTITYLLYEPFAQKDETKIILLSNLFAKLYRYVAFIVLGLGIFLIPFLKNIVVDYTFNDIYLIYILYLSNSVLSYFFSYKRSILIADQNMYINTKNTFYFYILQNILQILMIINFGNFILYLCIQIFCTVVSNIFISRKADSMYPFLKYKLSREISKKEKSEIFKNIRAMALHNFSTIVINGTDNIIISTFIGIHWVGLYSNYLLIINAITSILIQFFNSITASVGNFNVLESKELSYKMYKNIMFLNFWLYGICTICLYVLLNPFIKVWLGDDFLLSKYTVIILILNFYISGMRMCTLTYRNTVGLFYNDRYRPLFTAVINLIFSIILVKYVGLIGVFLGTFMSNILTTFWIEPIILYKVYFNKSIIEYFIKYFRYLSLLIIVLIIVELVCFYINIFIFKVIVCFISANVLFYFSLYRTIEFNYFNSLIKNILKNRFTK